MKNIIISANKFKNFFLFRHDLIKVLHDKRYNIYLVAEFDSYEIKFKKFNIINLNFQSNKTSLINDLFLISNIFRTIRNIKPEYILTFTIKPNIYFSFASKFFKSKVISNVSGLGSMYLTSKTRRVFSEFLYKISLNGNYVVFFQNKFDLNYFTKNKITSINQSDLIPGSGVECRKSYIKTKINKVRKVIFAGRLIYEKGIIEYINATKNIKNEKFQFYIAGEHDPENSRSIDFSIVKSWIKKKNCYYLNEVSDLQNELKRFDVLVLPSYREGLSKVLLEACNAGLPIITTDVPGCNELVVNNGFIIEPKSSISLEKALLKFSKLSDDKILNFGKNSIELIKKKYSIDIVIDKYLDKIT